MRSSGGKTLTRIDNVEGMISAAPTPMSARQAMSWVIDVDSDAATQASMNSTRPSCSAPLRP